MTIFSRVLVSSSAQFVCDRLWRKENKNVSEERPKQLSDSKFKFIQVDREERGISIERENEALCFKTLEIVWKRETIRR